MVAVLMVYKLYLNKIVKKIAVVKNKKNKDKLNTIKALIVDSFGFKTTIHAYFYTVITWEHYNYATAKNILTIHQSTLKL